MLIYENKLGVNKAVAGPVGYYPHLHHHIELVYVYEGSTNVAIGSNNYLLNKDDVMIVFPNQIHSYSFEYQTKNMCYILIYSPDDYPEFKDIFNLKIPINPVINKSDTEIKDQFINIIKHFESNNAYKDTLERGHMLILLSKIFDLMKFTDQNSYNLSTIQNVLLYCDNNYTSDISLEKLAAELFISKFYLSHIFNEKIKINFSNYINALRINDAMQQLRQTTQSITEIAYSVGYKSIRSFNNQFVNQTGITPSEYRKTTKDTKEYIN